MEITFKIHLQNRYTVHKCSLIVSETSNYNNYRSYSDEKFYSAAYELDLDTMNVTKVPYGTIYANGYKLNAVVKDNTDSLNWMKYDIIDNSTTTMISKSYIV